MQLVDDGVAERGRRPARVAPGKLFPYQLGGPLHALGLKRRAGVGKRRAAVKAHPVAQPRDEQRAVELEANARPATGHGQALPALEHQLHTLHPGS